MTLISLQRLWVPSLCALQAYKSQISVMKTFIQVVKHGSMGHSSWCSSPVKMSSLCSLQINGQLQQAHNCSYQTAIWNPSDFIASACLQHHRDGRNGVDINDHVNNQHFYEQLNGLASSKQIFKFVCSLEELCDKMAAAVLLRVAQVEMEEGELKHTDRVFQDKVFKALCFQFEHDSQRVSTAGLVGALHALVQLRVDPWSTLMVRLISESQDRLDRGKLNLRNLCILGESLLQLEGTGCAMLLQIMGQMQKIKLQDWAPEEVAMVYSMLEAGVGDNGQYQGLLNRMNDYTVSIVSQLSPKVISNVLHALVVLNQTQAIPLVINLCKHSVKHVPNFTNEELTKVLEAFVHFGHSDRYFTEALERYIPKACFTMDPEAVSRVMQYCSRRKILSRPIFDAVAESFVYNSDNFTTRQVAWQIIPFGKLNYLPPSAASLFRKLENILSNRFAQFQPRTLLNLLHSCTLMERFPVNFVSKIFNPYFLQQLQSQDGSLDRSVLSQLTQLYLTVTLECPFYEGPRLLPKYRVKTFLTHGCSLESSVDLQLYHKVKSGLIELLGARMYFASHVLTPYCYTLDVEIKLDEDGFVLPATHHEDAYKRIALCIDGQRRFCTNNHNLLGKEAIKQRHLKLLGYEVVQIPFYEFEVLEKNEEIVDYLHKKIFPHTFRLSW
ncbi:FAST kinase domain-containing protein 3, mitochondrial [Ambystoma mexicanum]|uniref:FAST kinase domain-containing protein 3, mitochondrial n=1 Tax=Ambystoma mexicanum TaxID=8296 RepID=UPI0037E7711C